jgi:RimJ/RimL family protein N-acetyltransferase
MKYLKRSAAPDDASALIDLYCEFYAETGMQSHFNRGMEEATLVKWIEDRIEEHRVTLWLSEGAIVGFSHFLPERNELFGICIEPNSRRQGIAQAAIKELQSHFEWISTRPVTRSSKNLVAKLGFTQDSDGHGAWKWSR